MRALVTGGGGFLGRRIVELLIERGDEVSFLARNAYPSVKALGAKGLQVDLRDKAALLEVVTGFDMVFHTASTTGFWAKPSSDLYYQTNVLGTENLIEAIKRNEIPKLIYTSTPSVVGYLHDIQNGGQDLPYAKTHESVYPRTKAQAEREVLRANGPQLATVALRPHLIFGPGDKHLLPRIVQRATAGKMTFVGDGTNKVDVTYIDNAAWAHLDAADALKDPTSACAGKPYFIGNEDPVILVSWLNDLLMDLGVPRVKKRISLKTARRLGAVLELTWGHLPLPGEPKMTPFLASALARDHWYDPAPARQDLGYSPRVNMRDATAATVNWLQRSVLTSEVDT